jgi:hypothetical protein
MNSLVSLFGLETRNVSVCVDGIGTCITADCWEAPHQLVCRSNVPGVSDRAHLHAVRREHQIHPVHVTDAVNANRSFGACLSDAVRGRIVAGRGCRIFDSRSREPVDVLKEHVGRRENVECFVDDGRIKLPKAEYNTVMW